MSTLVRSLVIAALIAVPSAALAQDDDDLFPDDVTGDPVELPEDEGTSVPFDEDAPSGAEEDPDAPVLAADAEARARAAAAGAEQGYPQSFAARPLTLPRAMSRVSLEAAFGGQTPKIAYRIADNDELLRLGGVAHAEYGITEQMQLGVHYGIGTLDDDTFHTGKTVSVSFHYLVFDWLAPYIETPILVDPFQIAVALGAPMRFRIGDRLALFVDPSLTITFTDFVPFVADAASTAHQAEDAEVGTVLDDGDVTVRVGATYQLDERLAVRGSFGQVARDFSLDSDPGAPLLFELLHAAGDSLDLGGRIGFMNLADAGETITVGIMAALRI